MTINSTELEALKALYEVVEKFEGTTLLSKDDKAKIKEYKRAIKSLEKKRAKHNESMAKLMVKKRAEKRAMDKSK